MIIKHMVIPLNTSSDKNRVDDLFMFWFKKVFTGLQQGTIPGSL
jgi:hypothetical protein